MKSTTSRRDFIAGLTAAGVLSARSRARAADASDWQAGAPAKWHDIMKAAQAEGQITVAAFPLLADPMTAAFQRDTGIHINFLGGKTFERSARLEAEARAKNMTIDVLIGGGQELGFMMHNGLLNPVAPQLMLPGVAPKNFRGGELAWMDDARQYNLIGAEYVFGWLLVNKDVIDPGEIKSWKTLLEPKYKGKIAAFDPRSPGPGQGAIAWIYNAFGLDFIKDLFIGQNVTYTVEDRGLVEDVVRGTHPIAFGAIQTEVERFRKAGISNLAVVEPADGPGYLTSGFSVLKQAVGVPHPNAATVFINWYVSKPGQEVYESVMLETSRRTDVHTGIPDYLVPKPNIKYYDQDTEAEYNSRKPVVALITDALGKR
ncbi:MAG TPA: extracellular solute-binding protein [Stellaceae bacterium]|nr:extracellular solute-binding protein [Stellaceae bacterium]